MFKRKLIDYLPPVLQRVMEFEAVTGAQQPEIEAAWDALGLVMDNQFIDTATEAGVKVWEGELNIVPLASDTLEDRKKRLKTAWTYGVVYTYSWLVNWLKGSCGENNPLPTISDYTLHVSVPVSVDYPRILENIRRHISVGVLIDPLILLSKIRVPHYTGAACRYSVKQAFTATEIWDTDSINLLADENSKVLMEEAENKIFYEEAALNGA